MPQSRILESFVDNLLADHSGRSADIGADRVAWPAVRRRFGIHGRQDGRRRVAIILPASSGEVDGRRPRDAAEPAVGARTTADAQAGEGATAVSEATERTAAKATEAAERAETTKAVRATDAYLARTARTKLAP